MRGIKRVGGSPAIVVAVLALAAALTGTAVAGPSATTSVSTKQVKKIAKKEAKKQVKKSAGSISEVSDSTTIAPGAAGTAEVSCGGKKVIGGGWMERLLVPVSPAVGVIEPYENRRTDNGWRVSALNTGAGTRTIKAYAYCL